MADVSVPSGERGHFLLLQQSQIIKPPVALYFFPSGGRKTREHPKNQFYGVVIFPFAAERDVVHLVSKFLPILWVIK
jgi:hypothetical protein